MAIFTVVIPLFNKANYISNTLESVLAQTFQDFEVIIVEDCSTDASFEVVSSIQSDKIKIIRHEHNKGLSASRNTGIKNATTKHIAFLDADDVWKPNYLETIYSLMQQFPDCKLFATNYEEIYPNQLSLLPTTKLKNQEKETVIEDFFESNLSQHIYCCCSLCVDKSVFETVGYYDEEITYGEDVDFNIRANNAFQLAYSTDVLVSYILYTENQITNTNLNNKTLTNFDNYEALGSEKPSLKKYLDFNRYIMAKFYKMEGNFEAYQKMKAGISTNPAISGLNYKQRFLLNAPRFILNLIKKVKLYFTLKGYKITTYSE
jgi:glycosyltransferase involved in cell wall biosynthesis